MTTNDDGHVWLTLSEAAEYIRAGDARIIRAAIRSGALRAYQYGERKFRLTKTDIDAWMKSNEAGAQ